MLKYQLQNLEIIPYFSIRYLRIPNKNLLRLIFRYFINGEANFNDNVFDC